MRKPFLMGTTALVLTMGRLAGATHKAATAPATGT